MVRYRRQLLILLLGLLAIAAEHRNKAVCTLTCGFLLMRRCLVAQPELIELDLLENRAALLLNALAAAPATLRHKLGVVATAPAAPHSRLLVSVLASLVPLESVRGLFALLDSDAFSAVFERVFVHFDLEKPRRPANHRDCHWIGRGLVFD